MATITTKKSLRALSSHCMRSSRSIPVPTNHIHTPAQAFLSLPHLDTTTTTTTTNIPNQTRTRTRTHQSRRPLPTPEFLAPSASTLRHLAPISRLPTTAISTARFSSTSAGSREEIQTHTQTQPQTKTKTETVAIVNPRRDENGVEMAVEITSRASRRLREIMLKDSNPNLALRITVESGGCHGFQYLMSLTTLPTIFERGMSGARDTSVSGSENAAASVDEDDTVFEATDGTEAKVVMDGPSLELLKGSKIDYTMELIGSQFKIVDNPLATSSCGCGTSFDIKI